MAGNILKINIIRPLSIYLALLITSAGYTQQIQGLWVGEIEVFQKKKRIANFPIAFDLILDTLKNEYTGINRTLSAGNIYVNFSIWGYFDSVKNSFYLEEKTLLETNSEKPEFAIKNYYILRLTEGDILAGDVFCFNITLHELCKESVSIFLKRKKAGKN